MKKPWMLPALIAMFVLTVLCCLCAVAAIGMYFYSTPTTNTISLTTPYVDTVEPATSTPLVIRPTSAAPTSDGNSPNTKPEAIETPENPEDPTGVQLNTLDTLENTVVPINDLIDLAIRLKGETNIPATLPAPTTPLKVGDQKEFWITNADTNKSSKTAATLRYVTDHVYFWIENGVSYDNNELKSLAETFENKIYPTNREFFGSEWSPGIDNNPHLYILYAHGLGSSIAGYFSSADEFPPAAHEYSNGHEMFLLSVDNVALDEEYAYSVLAHEFQHMIHWYTDRNEETWMNEGFSDVAMMLNDYGIGGHDSIFVMNPDIQLTDWPTSPDQRTAHYGSSFMFLAYFLDRFKEVATQALVKNPANGMVSIDEVLNQMQAKDAETGQPVGADDVFADWAITNYLKDGEVGDGRYTYNNYPMAPQTSETDTINNCPSSETTSDVSQYGTDYILINCEGNYNIHFEGSTQVGVLAENPHSGKYAFWSNKGDDSDMTLTRTFDFSQVSGPISLNYWTWYDLEEDYDYLFVEASLDGGKWEILKTPSGTDEDPSGNSYGWGYNHTSGGLETPIWIQESIDLSQFAGKSVQIRFEYVTDAAVNGEGLLLDDVEVPQINYQTDFEQDDGGWQGNGFVRIENTLPQSYRVSLIRLGDATIVEKFTLTGSNAIDIPLDLTGDADQAVLVISGTARYTRQKAAYRFSIQPAQ